MSSNLFLNLLIILVLAKLVGEILVKYGYPSIVGEIATGIILGPSVLGVIHPDESLSVYADLGFLLILLYAGLSIDISQLTEETRRGAIVAVLSVASTVVIGYAVGKFFGYSDLTSVSIGIALSISSIGMGIRVLMDLDQLQTHAGMTLVSAAVIDDVMGVVMLGAVVGIASMGGQVSTHILNLILRIGVFFFIIFLVGFHLNLPEKIERAIEKSRTKGTKISFVFAAMFVTITLAHLTGVHGVIGAFFAGLMLNKAFQKERGIHNTIMLITFGFFAPIAYSWVGLNTMLAALVTNLPLLVTILITGFAARIISGLLGSKCAGLEWGDSLVVGVGLTGRAGIELIVIEVMRLSGLIDMHIYSSIVILTAAACILMPFMLKFACSLR